MTPQEIRDWIATRVPEQSVDAVLSVLEGLVDGTLDDVFVSLKEERIRRFWQRNRESWEVYRVREYERRIAESKAWVARDPTNQFNSREQLAGREADLANLLVKEARWLTPEVFTPFLAKPCN